MAKIFMLLNYLQFSFKIRNLKFIFRGDAELNVNAV